MPYASDLVANIDADTRKFDRKAAAVDRQLKKLASSDPEVTVDADTRKAQAEIRSVEQALTGIEDESVSVLAATDAAQADIQSVEASLAGLGDESVAVTADTGTALGDIQGVEAALVGIEDQDVRVTADTQEAQANVQSLEAALAGLEDQTVKVTQETQRIGGAVVGMGGGLREAAATAGLLRGSLAGIAGGGAAVGIWNVASAASDLAESANVVGINFGDAADEMFSFTAQAPRNLGLSTRAANELSAGISGLLGNMGFAQDETLSWSKDLLTLGSDMGSAFNADPADAIMAIGSALRGETEPIRRFNVMLSAAKVETEAVSMGLHDGSGALSDYAKAAATLSIIMRDTEKIQGDFANTSKGLANTTRSLSGEFENFKAEAGEGLAPALAKVLGIATGGLRILNDWSDAFTHQRDKLLGWGDAADTAAPKVEKLTADQYNLAESARTGRPAADDLAGGIEGVGDKAGTTRTKVADLQTALDRLIGVHVSAEQAQIRFEESLLRVEQSLEENGHHLDGNSEKTLKLRGDVASAVGDTLSYAEALKNQNRSQGEVNTFLVTARQRLIDEMVAKGANRAEVERHIDSLGLNRQALDRVAASTDAAKWRTDEMKGAIAGAQGAVSTATGVFGGWVGRLGETTGAATTTKGATDNLRGSIFGIPTSWHTRLTGDTSDADAKFDAFVRKWSGADLSWQAKLKGNVTGDGPGRGGGGPALAKVQQAMQGIPGLAVTSTYRNAWANAKAGGAPNSYHMDRSNPAVDVGGPTSSLDRLAARLRMMGGWREGPIWRAPGHYDHVHVAHGGGRVSSSWYRMPGDGPDERTVRLQVGEQVIPRMHAGGTVGGGGNTYVTVVVQGSLVRERDVARQIGKVQAGSARGRGR